MYLWCHSFHFLLSKKCQFCLQCHIAGVDPGLSNGRGGGTNGCQRHEFARGVLKMWVPKIAISSILRQILYLFNTNCLLINFTFVKKTPKGGGYRPSTPPPPPPPPPPGSAIVLLIAVSCHYCGSSNIVILDITNVLLSVISHFHSYVSCLSTDSCYHCESQLCQLPLNFKLQSVAINFCCSTYCQLLLLSQFSMSVDIIVTLVSVIISVTIVHFTVPELF